VRLAVAKEAAHVDLLTGVAKIQDAARSGTVTTGRKQHFF
jgi:hypothetical protein